MNKYLFSWYKLSLHLTEQGANLSWNKTLLHTMSNDFLLSQICTNLVTGVSQTNKTQMFEMSLSKKWNKSSPTWCIIVSNYMCSNILSRLSIIWGVIPLLQISKNSFSFNFRPINIILFKKSKVLFMSIITLSLLFGLNIILKCLVFLLVGITFQFSWFFLCQKQVSNTSLSKIAFEAAVL